MHAAVLVIHGIGEQNPYETLDSFTRGLAGHFGDVSPSQAPVIRPERINHGSWTEVVIHLEFPGPVTPAGLERLTLYEFYWASYTEGKVTYRGVLSWVIQTGLTPLRYLSDNLQALRAANPNQAWGESAWLLLREMLRIGLLYLPIIVLTSLLGVAMTRGVPGLLPLARALGDAIEVEDHPVALAGLAVCLTVGIVLAGFMVREVWQWIRRPDRSIERKAEVAWLATAAVSLVLLAGVGWWCARPLGESFAVYSRLLFQRTTANLVLAAVLLLFARRILIGFVGDVAVYVSADEKAASFQARSAILKESVATLSRILVDARGRYDRVIVAGHSLGSVIAYDTINKLLSQVWVSPDQAGDTSSPAITPSDLAKLKGLVTFGSPLDKIYYFFREQVQSDQAVRAQILNFLYGFRRCSSGRNFGPFEFTYSQPTPPGHEASATPTLASDFQWVNIWSPMDPVSGQLRFYDLPKDDRLRLWYWLWGVAHLQYWRDPRFYKFVAERMF
jgi:hypothetical protein